MGRLLLSPGPDGEGDVSSGRFPENRMHLGLFMMPIHMPGRRLQDMIREDTEKIIFAEQLDFAEAWVGEHFSATTEPLTSPLMFMASLLPVTSRIKLGTGVINLPNHHPAIVAGEVALFDHMSNGRFLFGIGPGGLASDLELFGNQDAQLRAEKMLESIDIILRIWGQDPPYQINGRYWDIEIQNAIVPSLGVGFMPKPFQEPHPPIAVSAMSPDSVSVRTAAMHGWIPISANFVPDESVASHWRKYKEGCADVGREPIGSEWRVARNIMVAPTEAEAKERALDPDGSTYFYYKYLWEGMKNSGYTIAMRPRRDMPDEQVTIEGLIEHMVIYGTASTVLDRLIAFRDSVGPFGTLLLAAMDWSGVSGTRERYSIKRIAEHIMPRFSQHADTTVHPLA
jgi:alkanesulfonate monooxygenase SsuD/methylene tetrahydromethanopterin reductase-like flavin-dependent oxidoreductase (luciferase family)